MLKMPSRSANFVIPILLFVSYGAGITGTVCGFAENAAYGLADVAPTRRLEFALRSSSPAWYHDGMQLFAYLFNGYYWEKTDLTWAIVNEPSKVPMDRVVAAVTNAFKLWSEVTPFRFTPASPDLPKADIRISFEKCDERILCDTKFPTDDKVLDGEGVTIVINDDVGWTNRPYTPDWHNLNFAMLYEVTHCLGLNVTRVEDSVMNEKHRGFSIKTDSGLGGNDILGIQQLYKFPRITKPTSSDTTLPPLPR